VICLNAVAKEIAHSQIIHAPWIDEVCAALHRCQYLSFYTSKASTLEYLRLKHFTAKGWFFSKPPRPFKSMLPRLLSPQSSPLSVLSKVRYLVPQVRYFITRVGATHRNLQQPGRDEQPYRGRAPRGTRGCRPQQQLLGRLDAPALASALSQRPLTAVP